MSESTVDALWGGRLTLRQPARGEGYRFNLDPVLLSGFVAAADHVLELGAGCGVLGLLLLRMNRANRVTAVEVQQDLARCALQNADANSVRLVVHHADMRQVQLPSADAAVFNPPYHRLGDGRGSPNSGRDVARREHLGTLKDFVEIGARHATEFITAIVPAARETELVGLCTDVDMGRIRSRKIIPHCGAAAGQVMVEARRGAAATIDEEPLVVHRDASGDFTDEVQVLVDGPASVWA